MAVEILDPVQECRDQYDRFAALGLVPDVPGDDVVFTNTVDAHLNFIELPDIGEGAVRPKVKFVRLPDSLSPRAGPTN